MLGLLAVGVAAATSTVWAAPAGSEARPKYEVLSGKVAGITSGDVLTLLVENGPVKIRLAGIDAPEAKQPFEAQARKALFAKVYGKTVRVLSMGKDENGWMLGVVYLEGCVNTQLVREGWAWQYREHCESKTLAEAEREARKKKAGLWADPDPMSPWEWRKARADEEAAAKQASAGEPKPDAPPSDVRPEAPQPEVIVYVTKTGKKYHRAGCRHIGDRGLPLPLEEAARQYAPCSDCKPPRPEAAAEKGPESSAAPGSAE